MTLKEKILQVANDLEKEAFTYPKMKTMDVVNIVLRRLANEYDEEKIKEEFAVKFSDWIRVCKLKQRPYDFENVRELLEIYKEEKGL